jgi:LPS-assembly lipoprotein
MSPAIKRLLARSLPLAAAALLSGCGFHLRESAALPPGMQHVHLTVNGGGDLQRYLARALESAGSTVEDHGGPGIAELKVPVAQFVTDTLSLSGAAVVTEYTQRYNVQFEVDDANGEVLVGRQNINMSREYSYDATNTIGSDSQVDLIRRSLNDDMVQAILFRLQAATKHPELLKKADPNAVPPPADTGTPMP